MTLLNKKSSRKRECDMQLCQCSPSQSSVKSLAFSDNDTVMDDGQEFKNMLNNSTVDKLEKPENVVTNVAVA